MLKKVLSFAMSLAVCVTALAPLAFAADKKEIYVSPQGDADDYG